LPWIQKFDLFLLVCESSYSNLLILANLRHFTFVYLKLPVRGFILNCVLVAFLINIKNTIALLLFDPAG